MSKLWVLFLVLCAVVALAGCGSEQSGSAEPEEAATEPVQPSIQRIDAVLSAKSGSELTGVAIFVKDAAGVSLQLNVENTPPGEHAVHIHEFGDCSADDASSAGGHWNPSTEDHGRWGMPPHHLGDIGNITVGEDGTGSLSLSTDRWTMGDGSVTDIVGKSIIVHADPDDFTSQPTGAAGGRIGCAVIETY
ncbi:MAG TPA: superoxide dismutase family protein [Candidatus Polarisedimenticolaceae bacterium]|nr:superoxide dismutase family protein [Candidatus Polarisedimenticolaceae bacterium]